MATHSDPESCVLHREEYSEALTGDTDRPAIALRNQGIGMPTKLTISEGNMEHGDNRKSCSDPTRSKTLRMSGSDLHRSWEISSAPTQQDGLGEEGASQHIAIHADEKSDTPIVSKKLANETGVEELVERRGVAKGNTNETTAGQTQSWAPASKGIEGIREAAKRAAVSRQTPKAGALCGSSARRDLCGGREVTLVPTATILRVKNNC